MLCSMGCHTPARIKTSASLENDHSPCTGPGCFKCVHSLGSSNTSLRQEFLYAFQHAVINSTTAMCSIHLGEAEESGCGVMVTTTTTMMMTMTPMMMMLMMMMMIMMMLMMMMIMMMMMMIMVMMMMITMTYVNVLETPRIYVLPAATMLSTCF